MKILFFIRHAVLFFLPGFYYENKKKILEREFVNYGGVIESRVEYYCKLHSNFSIGSAATSIKNYKRRGYSSYFYDLKEFLYYFPMGCRFNYYFGDETHLEPEPTLFKARPIDGNNVNSVLFKLDKHRHFRFVDDKLRFLEKNNLAVFRGAVTQSHRIKFMEAMYGNSLVDAGQSNTSSEHPEWQKPYMSVEEQLKYKFIVCLEGNDVASNLKWAMSSNSVVITPKMKFETWFMEGTLVAGKHYVEVKDDFSDMEEKIRYYIEHPEEAEEIINNAHDYIRPFQNEKLEQLVCIKTLERYFELSGQLKKSEL